MLRCLRYAAAASLLILHVAAAAPAAAPRINRQIEDSLRNLMANHAFDALVPSDWKLEGISAGRDRLEVKFSDPAAQAHSVELWPEMPPKSDGRGHFFYFRLSAGAESPQAAKALLAVAQRIDAATTPGALLPEAAPQEAAAQNFFNGPLAAQLGYDDTNAVVPRWTALFVGAVQSVLVIAAIVIALRTPAAPRLDS